SNVLGNAVNKTRTITVGDRVAGYVGSWESEGQRLLGYWLGQEFWGQGLAGRAVAEYLRDHERARPMHAYVAQSNVRSIRVLQKCGFESCGQPIVGDDG